MLRRFVLDDLQRPDASALLASRTQEQAPITCRPEQGGTGRRQVGAWIQIPGNTDSVPEDGGVDVVVRIDVDTAHQLDQLSRLSSVVAASLVQGFANEVERHSNFPVLQVRLS